MRLAHQTGKLDVYVPELLGKEYRRTLPGKQGLMMAKQASKCILPACMFKGLAALLLPPVACHPDCRSLPVGVACQSCCNRLRGLACCLRVPSQQQHPSRGQPKRQRG